MSETTTTPTPNDAAEASVKVRHPRGPRLSLLAGLPATPRLRLHDGSDDRRQPGVRP